MRGCQRVIPDLMQQGTKGTAGIKDSWRSCIGKHSLNKFDFVILVVDCPDTYAEEILLAWRNAISFQS